MTIKKIEFDPDKFNEDEFIEGFNSLHSSESIWLEVEGGQIKGDKYKLALIMIGKLTGELHRLSAEVEMLTGEVNCLHSLNKWR